LILEDIKTAAGKDSLDADISSTFWQSTGGADFSASANDIIEWDGTQWTVAFDSSAISVANYVTNATTSIQYKWTGSAWLKSFEGEYQPQDWRVVI